MRFMMKRFTTVFVLLWINLWITSHAWAWGTLGHKTIAEFGTRLADPTTLSNCRITVQQIVEHTNDPDSVWRQQRFKHPHEAQAHYFHVIDNLKIGESEVQPRIALRAF